MPAQDENPRTSSTDSTIAAVRGQAGFRRFVRETWRSLQKTGVGDSFVNIEGGGIEQQRDKELQLHHCANYAAVLTLLQDKGPNLRVLELGCGTGVLSYAFARLVPEGWSLTATDYSDRLIEYARTNYQHPNLEFTRLDVRDLTPDYLARFDAVLFLEVIEHLEPSDVAGLLAKLHSGLRPGAMLVLSTLDRTPFPRPFSGYAPHCVEYTYDSLSVFLADRQKSPFEQSRVFRLVSPLIAAKAVRAEQRGGYLANRMHGFILGLADRSRAFRRLYGSATSAAFRLYVKPRRNDSFDLEGYLGSLEFVQDRPESHGANSFGLIAVLEKQRTSYSP